MKVEKQTSFDEKAFDEAYVLTRLLGAVLGWGAALQKHEAAKSDPTQNVGTGQSLYSAEVTMRATVTELLTKMPAVMSAVHEKMLDEMVEAAGLGEQIRREGMAPVLRLADFALNYIKEAAAKEDDS